MSQPAELLVRLEGFHAVKHALRFGAELRSLVTHDPDAVELLHAELASDIDLAAAGLRVVDAAEVTDAAGRPLPSPLLGMAVRPTPTLADAMRGDGPVVVLEQPRHLGNVGAVIRVAAAAGAAAVITTGDLDPWHPMVVRGAAGLHFALPVLHATLTDVAAAAAAAQRPVVAIDGDGPAMTNGVPARGVLLLGTERHGLTDQARAAADRAIAIPMRAGVSSLNLATAAAVVLYAPRR